MNRIIFYAMITLGILMIFNREIFSQKYVSTTIDAYESLAKDTNSLKSGMWAIQFAIGSNFTLKNFEDASLSIKKQLSDKTALRLSFTGMYNKRERSINETVNMTRSFGCNVIFVYYLNPTEDFIIYLNSGPEYSYAYNSEKGTGFFNRNKLWSFGLTAGLGSEYFVFEELSLFAEYSYLFSYGKQEFLNQSSGTTSTSTDEITSFQQKIVKFGISVYFDF